MKHSLAVAASVVLCAVATATAAPAAYAQERIDKPIRILVGFAPGGTADIIARVVAEKMAPAIGQPVIVENRPGAIGRITADAVKAAAPDGTTLMVMPIGPMAVVPHVYKDITYDPIRDFTPVALGATFQFALAAGPASGAKTWSEFAAWAKANPAKAGYATSGAGSLPHFFGVLLGRGIGVEMVHVPYKGSSQAHVDILGGNVEMMFDTTSSAMPQIKAGRFKPLAVTSPQRSAELPNVPTIAEAGYPAAEMTTWYGLFVTGGTPKPVVDKLAAELKRVLALPDVQAKLRGLGGEPGAMTQEQFAAFNKAEFERFGKLIKTANIKAD